MVVTLVQPALPGIHEIGRHGSITIGHHPPRSSPFPPSLTRDLKRTPGGQFSVGAMPRSYQVTPGVPAATGDNFHEGQHHPTKRCHEQSV